MHVDEKREIACRGADDMHNQWGLRDTNGKSKITSKRSSSILMNESEGYRREEEK